LNYAVNQPEHEHDNLMVKKKTRVILPQKLDSIFCENRGFFLINDVSIYESV